LPLQFGFWLHESLHKNHSFDPLDLIVRKDNKKTDKRTEKTNRYTSLHSMGMGNDEVNTIVKAARGCGSQGPCGFRVDPAAMETDVAGLPRGCGNND